MGQLHDGAWAELEARLNGTVARLEPGGYAIASVAVPGGLSDYYVQFRQQGADGFGIEAVSNAFLPSKWRLTEEAGRELLRQGWPPPSRGAGEMERQPGEDRGHW